MRKGNINNKADKKHINIEQNENLEIYVKDEIADETKKEVDEEKNIQDEKLNQKNVTKAHTIYILTDYYCFSDKNSS